MAAESYFDDAGDAPRTAPAPLNQEKEERDDSNVPTAVLPRSFFEAAGKTPEPGSVCTLRVVAVHDDSVEVEYESSEEEPELEEAPAMNQMAEMMY